MQLDEPKNILDQRIRKRLQMKVNKARIQNFRILSDSILDLNDGINLMIGRNNTGKTSFMVLFEKFFKQGSFDFNDFSIKIRDKLTTIDVNTDETELSIQLILNINYEEDDNLCNLSEFIIDLDPDRMDVNILLECFINKEKLINDMDKLKNISKEKFITKYISEYLEKKVYTFDIEDDLKKENRHKLIEKDFKSVRKLIDFEIIHAKRSVSSSEEKSGKKVLSNLTTTFFNSNTTTDKDKFEEVNKVISEMDASLNKTYDNFFKEFLDNAKDFLSMVDLKVVSNLKAKEILSDSSEVVYGGNNKLLPEYLNGLGHMNVLYLLLDIEMKKNNLKNRNSDIKLLFIEEPEAHTHPQLQYIFARKISDILKVDGNLQSVISTHSPHIVSKHPFKNIRYMLRSVDNVKIINFHDELEELYGEENNAFKFLKQYLSVESAELFFADKVIFIEGVSENFLINSFIEDFDNQKINVENKTSKASEQNDIEKYIPLSTQNITILQVGANAKVFSHFLELLKIHALIITDIDTTCKNANKRYVVSKVEDDQSCNTSNETIKHYLNAPKVNDNGFAGWYSDMVEHNFKQKEVVVYIAYQGKEKGYHARSFEDAFIHINLQTLKEQKSNLWGLKNIGELETNTDIYSLTEDIIGKKSDFASSLLYLKLTENVEWKTPLYIKEGLEWLQKQKI